MRCEAPFSTGETGSSRSAAYLETGGEPEQCVLTEEPGQEQVEVSAGNEEPPGSQQAEAPTVLKLSFSEDQDLSKLTASNEQSFFESTRESNIKDAAEESAVSEQGSSDMLTSEDDEKLESSCFSEEQMEPSTDEELRMWRYPQSAACLEEDEEQEVCVKQVEAESSQVDQTGSSTDKIQAGDPPSDVPEIAGCSDMQEGEKPKAEGDESTAGSCLDVSETDRSALERPESRDGSSEGLLTTERDGPVIKQEQEDMEVCPHNDAAAEQPQQSQTVCIIEDVEPQSRDPQAAAAHQALREQEHEGLQRSTEDEAQPAVKSEAAVTDAAQVCDQDSNQRLNPDFSVTEETPRSSKKVTFILEPEFISSSGGSDHNTSTETALSGEGSASTWAA